MLSYNDSVITFDDDSKIKNWLPPEGIYRAIFREKAHDNNGRIVLRFEITRLQDPIYTYWARHGYRRQDKWKLTAHILNWVGEDKIREFFNEGVCNLQQFYGWEADIVVGLIDTGKEELLRVIQDIRPPGSLLPVDPVVGEYEI